jgi:2-polyprenyl-3-methyl-5-hydroxy-6-metoxy-1,4-benzoquinol methylase
MPKLISDAYQKLNSELHKSDQSYGTSAGKIHAKSIADAIRQTDCKSLLDYGCGKGTLKAALQPMCPLLEIREYDPAIPGKDGPPQPAEFVACFDVMEHIEPDSLDAVIAHIASLTKRFAFLVISLQEAEKTLADGRNAHLIVRPREWWLDKLSLHLSIRQESVIANGHEMMVFAVPKS